MNVRNVSSNILHVDASTRAQLIQEHRNLCLQRRKEELKYEMTFRNDGPAFQRTVNVQRMPSVRHFSAPKASENNNFHSKENQSMESNNCNHGSTRPNNSDFERKEDIKMHYNYESNPFSVTRHAEVDRPKVLSNNPIQTTEIDSMSQNRNIQHMDMVHNSKENVLSDNISTEQVDVKQDEDWSAKMKKQSSNPEESSEKRHEEKEEKDNTVESISELKFFLNDRDYMRKYVMNSSPKRQGMVECYVKRIKKNLGVNIEYSVFLKEGDVFLMSAKKRSKKQTSNYLISLNR